MQSTCPRPPPTCIDLLGDLLHGQFAVGHVLAVELDAQQPRRDTRHIEVGHLIVDVDPLLVLCHHRVLRVWVVVDGRVRRHLRKGERKLSSCSASGSIWLPIGRDASLENDIRVVEYVMRSVVYVRI